MKKNYAALLGKLRQSLSTAIDNQEYHRLMELDAAVNACVSEAVACVVDASSALSQAEQDALAQQIRALQTTYHKASQICVEKSAQLKAEYSKMNQSKKGAQNYLQVATKF